MGAIQSSINQMLGTVAAVTTGAKHIKEQETMKQLKGIEATQEAFNAENALKANTESIAQEMVEAGEDKALAEVKPGETPAEAEDRAVGEYLETKSEAAEDKYQQEMAKVKNPKTSKRVKAARDAANNLQDEINARKNLKFNVEIAKKKLEILKVKKAKKESK